MRKGLYFCFYFKTTLLLCCKTSTPVDVNCVATSLFQGRPLKKKRIPHTEHNTSVSHGLALFYTSLQFWQNIHDNTHIHTSAGTGRGFARQHLGCTNMPWDIIGITLCGFVSMRKTKIYTVMNAYQS